MKLWAKMKEYGGRLATGGALALGTVAAHAGGEGPDFSSLTDAISFDGMATVVIGGAAALAGLYVVVKGVKIVLGFIR